MALINCPHCKKQVSSKAETCMHCNQPLKMTAENLEILNKNKRRSLRKKLYKYKMLSFVAMALALIGAVPMVWDYARSVDYGFTTSALNHWGTTWVILGFILYVVSRVMMVVSKRNSRK